VNKINETKVTNEVKTKTMKFSTSSIFVKISFIIGLSAIVAGSVTVGIVYAIQPNPWIILAFYILMSLLGLTGTITGGIAFKEGKNIFSILGFIFSLGVSAFFIYGIIFISALIAQS
jgi:hypothetical protein